MNIYISEIEWADYDQLITLITEFAHFEKLPHLMTNTVERMQAESDYLKGYTAKDAEGNILGYAICFFAYYSWSGKSLYMDDLYVREKNRSEGIGSALINKVISMAKEHNCNCMRWQVSNWNTPAINFYKKLGAVINEVERNCDLKL